MTKFSDLSDTEASVLLMQACGWIYNIGAEDNVSGWHKLEGSTRDEAFNIHNTDDMIEAANSLSACHGTGQQTSKMPTREVYSVELEFVTCCPRWAWGFSQCSPEQRAEALSVTFGLCKRRTILHEENATLYAKQFHGTAGLIAHVKEQLGVALQGYSTIGSLTIGQQLGILSDMAVDMKNKMLPHEMK